MSLPLDLYSTISSSQRDALAASFADFWRSAAPFVADTHNGRTLATREANEHPAGVSGSSEPKRETPVDHSRRVHSSKQRREQVAA